MSEVQREISKYRLRYHENRDEWKWTLPMTCRCRFCDEWSFTGPAGEALLAHAEHRKTEHPEARDRGQTARRKAAKVSVWTR